MTHLRGVSQLLGLSLPLVVLMGGSALAQSQTAQVRQESTPTIAAAPDSAPSADSSATPATPLDTYTYGDLFSIQLPESWTVAEPVEALPVIITSSPAASADDAAPANDIRTEVSWIEQPPAEVVPSALQEIKAKGYSLADYGTLTIDNATALQLWVVNIPESPTNALMTYIGYENGTALIISRFDQATPDLEEQLMQVHQSFTRL